jgi:hypothetical protein
VRVEQPQHPGMRLAGLLARDGVEDHAARTVHAS